MKTRTLPTSRSTIRVIWPLLLVAVLSDAPQALAQHPCPPAPGATSSAGLSVTAQQVEEGSASLEDFALSARDTYAALTGEFGTLEGIARAGCIVRQEGALSRSGSIYLVMLTPTGRVFAHAEDMSLSGRQLNPFIYSEVLSVLGASSIDLAGLTSPDSSVAAQASFSSFFTLPRQAHGPFDATTAVPSLRPGIPGAYGHAVVSISANVAIPLLLLAGFDLNESHLTQEAIDYGDPAITAKDVVDRETLQAFVAEARQFMVDSIASSDRTAVDRARIAMRDPNGPWRHGSVYLYVLDLNSNIILFHGAFPDRFELQPLVATGLAHVMRTK